MSNHLRIAIKKNNLYMYEKIAILHHWIIKTVFLSYGGKMIFIFLITNFFNVEKYVIVKTIDTNLVAMYM